MLGVLSSASEVTQYVNRLRGIGPVNSRVLVGAVFTTAFAGAAYLWPEIFGAWFSECMGGAFVFVSLYSLGPGFSQKAQKGVARGISDGVIDGIPTMQRRLPSYIEGVPYDALDSSAGKNRLVRMI